MKGLKALFNDYFGAGAASCEKLAASGSCRTYFRLKAADGRSAVGTVGTVPEENLAFLAIARHFAAKGLNVPRVFAVSGDGMEYLQSDLGDESLYAAVADGRKTGNYSPSENELLKKTVAYLPKLQFEGGDGLDYSVCYPQKCFDRRNILFDLNYFKYDYLKLTGVPFDEIALQDDFERLADDLLAADCPAGFMYRDFQGRNVMICDGEPWFIDFQGGRRGPVCYDLASFVWQASARYPASLREELVNAYIKAARPYADLDNDSFRATLRLFVLFRTLQVLGAYGFRGYIEKKGYFIASVPFALANAATIIDDGYRARYPQLCGVLDALSQSLRPEESSADDGRLTVEVTSFSFRQGVPADASGNGGGYVFDCRYLANPGRYEPYKKFNGLDANVIEFLEKEGGILVFLDHVKTVVFPHIDKFIERGFTHMMVSFGCTGGQHRSVYSAQHFAEAVAAAYDVDVIVRHTAINVNKRLK
ncbi:MAG: phosphotransferase [Bacteroidales bacterium]|nr:phosphotransferase [Bacteroidales bacterium]